MQEQMEMKEENYDVEVDDSEAWKDGSNVSCNDCPPDECSGHCMSCSYRSF